MCAYFGISRNCYYKTCKEEVSLAMQAMVTVDMVRERRRLMLRLGGKKLYSLLREDMQKTGKIGLDRFFRILRANGLPVERRRSYTRTTNSYHRFHKWRSCVPSGPLSGCNQVWASDITYIRTVEGFAYLSLVTDLYSRKIVG
jgi:hypothetical protein